MRHQSKFKYISLPGNKIYWWKNIRNNNKIHSLLQQQNSMTQNSTILNQMRQFSKEHANVCSFDFHRQAKWFDSNPCVVEIFWIEHWFRNSCLESKARIKSLCDVNKPMHYSWYLGNPIRNARIMMCGSPHINQTEML